MPQPPYALVIDQGGHSTRALVFDSELDIVAQSQYSIQTFHPQPRFAEHDAAKVAESLQFVLTEIASQLGSEVNHIQSAGLACQRSSIVCWDKQTGEVLTPVISWQDSRGHLYLNQLQAEQESIQQKTGLRLSPHYGASKIRWCLDNVPEVKAAYESGSLVTGSLVAWLAAQLTGNTQAHVDAVNAARTLLMNLSTRQWDEELCNLFGVPKSVLPHIADNNAYYGEIELDGHAVPLCYATGDQSAALFALGEPDPEVLYLNIGSGAFLQRVCEGKIPQVEGLLNSLTECASGKQLYSLEATINGAANALDWLAERDSVDVMLQLDEWLQETTDALFINAVGGLAAPWWRDDLESCFVNDTDTRSRAIAVIESVVFLVIVNMERMEDVLGEPDRIVASGGLSQLDGLCSRIASLTGISVYQMKELEATATGVARRLLPEIEREPGEYIFAPEDISGLTDRYTAWKSQMNALVTS
jgi:glycerol kinase